MNLKRSMLAALLLSAAAVPALAAVSVSIGDPNFYGRIDLGGGPPPAVINAQPVYGSAQLESSEPVYLRVPGYEQADWGRNCYRYSACGRPVYFVHEDWYRDHYGTYGAAAPVAPPPPNYAYRRRPEERVFDVPVASVHAVVGPPNQRCWVDREQVTEPNRPNVGGAVVGAVSGGILGHQIGRGHGNDAATVGGAVAGGAVGANVGRDSHVEERDVQRCENTASTTPEYWDVSYVFRGVEHHVQMTAPPGPTIAVNGLGEPRL